MASSSKIEDDEAQEEELERFDDFTLASSWERFISEIEAVCRLWLTNGPKNLLDLNARVHILFSLPDLRVMSPLAETDKIQEKGAVQLDFAKNIYKVKSELKHAMKSYWMEYYFEKENSGQVADWNGTLHDVQLCFGVKDFLLIAPQSASGVVLDTPESSKLLSAVAIALTNCSSYCPAFVPVHVPSRKAYIGIQNMGTVFTRRFEADHIGSQVPVKLMHLEGLYDLFVSKFAYSMMDIAMRIHQVCFTMKLTYRTIPYDEDDDIQGADSDNEKSGLDLAGETHNKLQWDDDCPWSEWYSTEDPVKGFDLIAIWVEKTIESSLEMAEMENASPYEAEKWLLLPKLSESSNGDRIGFASQLRLLVDALLMSFEAQFMEDFVSVENHGSDNSKSSMVIPPPSVLDRVLKELFHEGKGSLNRSKGEHKSSRAIKGAPLGSLFAQFCVHALWIGNCNIRAVAVLWVEFVREVRWCWEEFQSLPHMSTNGSVDLLTCLINQKLEMLAICIEMKREMNEEYQDCVGSMDESSDHHEENGQVRQSFVDVPAEEYNEKRHSPSVSGDSHDSGTNLSKTRTEPEERVSSISDSSDRIRKGSSGVLGSTLLLKSPERMHVPFTQKPPPMTEDMHEERLHAVEACADSVNFSAHLEKDILSSDMSAFKAANPEAVFEDFIRWHSPGDWEDDSIEESGSSSSSTSKDVKDDWPPQGRLSKRMSEQGNLWRKLWNDAPSLSAYEQKPLLDPDLEGEKVLHYLETLQPHQLLEQMVCTAFRASADTLNQTDFGGFKLMTTKIDQLYLTMVSVLRPLQSDISGNSEIIDDLKRLCVVFEHVEKLLTAAASLHRKLLQAPRLSEAIFSDYFKIYIPRMGSGAADIDMEMTTKQEVGMQERLVISNMFTPPTANQSWRKVISMGNLLNGHEPIVREIVFSMCDDLSGSHYASLTGEGYQDIETHRMYICGTSNDLRVALSVSSCD